MKKALQIKGAPDPIGPYSQAVMASNMLFVSGQIPMDPANGNIILDDIQAATVQVMENIKALLSEANLDFNHVVKCSIFLKDMNDFAIVNDVYAGYFSGVFPARETVQVSVLPRNVQVEISCIAVS